MREYYFTFGQIHTTLSGKPLANYYVTVKESNYNAARDLFIEKFTSVYMEEEDKFAFQYSSLIELEPELYPQGELAYITKEQILWKEEI